MAELVPVAMYEAADSGEIIFINAAFTRLTGYGSAAEVPDLPLLATSIRVGGKDLDISVSVGVAIATPRELGNVLSRADHALYEAKRSGRNCWAVDESAR